jgi:hypothetical protein
MHLSIQSSNTTIRKIYRHFDIQLKTQFPTIEDDNNLKIKLFDIIRNYTEKYNFGKNKFRMRTIVQIKDLCVGDFIEIGYTPPSIKYLKDYPELSGIVIYVDNDNNDGLIYSNEHGTETVYSIVRDYRGYCYDNSNLLFYDIRKCE